ncbi:MAG: hypothetical protein DCF25_13640 [Leptolyngbya foveolarum]|uniref:Uncharacterized protein n=1 Tax=Leptolyngbya foveolarum TaxID=47253 RepID=A0A2W4U355_9CYAN|nr:MAG: hypothetical protein DCF25_13640 [Leptolyngbya foveolarum]
MIASRSFRRSLRQYEYTFRPSTIGDADLLIYWLMGLFFRSFNARTCCLCGGQNKLTGEHKIKAAALKKEFGNQKLVIFNADDSVSQGIIAQSIKSKHLKFQASIESI